MGMMILLVVYLVLAVILGMMAKGSGRSFWLWFVVGCVLTPVAAYVIYFVVSKSGNN